VYKNWGLALRARVVPLWAQPLPVETAALAGGVQHEIFTLKIYARCSLDSVGV